MIKKVVLVLLLASTGVAADLDKLPPNTDVKAIKSARKKQIIFLRCNDGTDHYPKAEAYRVRNLGKSTYVEVIGQSQISTPDRIPGYPDWHYRPIKTNYNARIYFSNPWIRILYSQTFENLYPRTKYDPKYVEKAFWITQVNTQTFRKNTRFRAAQGKVRPEVATRQTCYLSLK